MDFCGLDLVQLHGNEPVSACSELAPRVIKAFRVQGEESLLRITDFKNHVRAILLDAYQKGLNGGTGKTFDWRLALKAKKTGIPMVLSGGLGPEKHSGSPGTGTSICRRYQQRHRGKTGHKRIILGCGPLCGE